MIEYLLYKYATHIFQNVTEIYKAYIILCNKFTKLILIFKSLNASEYKNNMLIFLKQGKFF